MHRVDKHIFKQLLTHERRRFSELKPLGIESNAFTYRLKRLLKEGMIAKTSGGQYYLTSAGRFYTDRLNLGRFAPRELARPVSLLVLRDGDEWLMYKRTIHPLRSFIGLPHANVHVGVNVVDDAENRLNIMGIETKLTYRGGGYLTFYKHGQLETYNQFNILENISPLKGELNSYANTDMGHYVRRQNPDFSTREYLPSLQNIAKLIEAKKFPFFVELEYHI